MPDDATLLRARAHAYQRLGDFTHAAADIDRAIEFAPHDPDALTQRGNLAAEQGKFEQAQEDFRQAIAIDPNWAEAYRSLAWLQATCPDRQFRNPQQAIAAAEQAAQLSPPDDYLILDTLAAAHACGGQFDQAVQFEEKALAAAPRELSYVARAAACALSTWPGVFRVRRRKPRFGPLRTSRPHQSLRRGRLPRRGRIRADRACIVRATLRFDIRPALRRMCCLHCYRCWQPTNGVNWRSFADFAEFSGNSN